MQRPESAALFAEAKHYFPGGVNSPVRAFKSVSGPPLFIRRGSGSHIYDEDGNVFLDFCCSWGPLILGHDNPVIRERIIETVRHGTSFGTPTRLGNEIGKFILDRHRYVEKLRFVSSGTEAVMSALRLARGVTGRTKIVKFEGCYHGHVDSLLVKAGSGLATFGVSTSAGIPEVFAQETIVLPLDDRQLFHDTMLKMGDQIAAVIVEPVPANNGLLLQDRDFLMCLRWHCYNTGALLIFDEVISGFRVGFEGAAGHYDIQPDIITFGKIIGGGMPVGAYAASAKIMGHVAPEGPVYQAGTLSANPVAMAAGLAALQQLAEPGFYTELATKTHEFVAEIQQFADEHDYELTLPHIGSVFWMNFSRERIIRSDQIDPAGMKKFAILHHELLQRGVYLGPSGYEVGFVSAAHSKEDLQKAAEKIKAALRIVFTTSNQ